MGVKVRERPKGSGIWWIFIDHRGKRKAKKVGRDRRFALETAKKIEAKLVLGDFGFIGTKKKDVPSFKDYSSLWLENYIKPLRRKATYAKYRDNLRLHVWPILGEKPIDEIKRVDIRNMFIELHKKGLSSAMLCSIRDAVGGPLNYAIDDEIIETNPVSGIMRRLNIEHEKRIPIEPMTWEEVDLFLSTCQTHCPEHYPFFLCALRTGMRLGELLGLHWGDIDFHGRFIRVRRSFKRGRIEKTKTGRERMVDMSNQLHDCLKRLLTLRKRQALEEGRTEPIEIVFHTKGGYTSQNSIRNVFKRMLKKAGMREMRLHNTRHTFASLLLSSGESPAYVKDQLGHSSIKITVDIYGHLIPSSNRNAVNRLDFPTTIRKPTAIGRNRKAVTY
ncbi:MAG: site-specific integrase [Deltaproteobacteria bacterium]|nr:site-specific integrase [Deltaproteobacteria bacterium]MBW2153938.1 site-specific integrase [Deltaproteobacteria bacterium]